ncbi:alkaline phosphatase family protein [Nocardioides sp. JQ2195]|uniref:alkaline phosphatase family protein n=1 Tax=Nocardioides sp. JQ2195 TaxID=2592334 RepID=UPI00143EB0AC|nr:nucleotide pyrophosphatase/phosphodiesterase family protein [Nocardioides sp. JQ2195]QIX26448.1 alkaline phosphatase family protein [Nocardioides sp. JQ2195]
MNAGFVEPAYGSRSLGDVVPAVAAALGSPLGALPSALTLPEASGYVVFLVDGLGQRLLERYAHAAPYLSEIAATPGTAGVPSTTATSLTSLGTGLTPGQHGLVGFTARVPGTDTLLNHLFWDQDVDPVEWQPHPTAFDHLSSAGVHVTAVNRRAFVNSGLTRSGHRGANFVGADNVAERLAGVLDAAGRSPSLTYVYDGDLDHTGHKHGIASREWLQELSAIDDAAERMREALPGSVRLVVVADHGMVDSPQSSRVDVDDRLQLRDGLALMGGEARFRHLYCRPGAVADVVTTWQEVLGDRASVLTRDEVIERGWLGPVESRVRARLGDVMVACHGDTAVVSTRDFAYENTLVGLHGSLTPDEMTIPIIVD